MYSAVKLLMGEMPEEDIESPHYSITALRKVLSKENFLELCTHCYYYIPSRQKPPKELSLTSDGLIVLKFPILRDYLIISNLMKLYSSLNVFFE